MKKVATTLLVSALFIGMAAAPGARAESERVLPVRAYAHDIPAGLEVNRTYFTAVAATEDEVLEFRRALIRQGARNVNLFLPDVVVCQLPPGLDVSRLPGAGRLLRTEETALRSHAGPSPAPARSDRLRWINSCYERKDELGQGDYRAHDEHGAPDDVVVINTPERVHEIARLLKASGVAAADAAALNQNSEFWGGDILVQTVFPESNGEYEDEEEDWTDEQLADAVSAVLAGMLDVQSQFRNMSIHYVFAQYERAETGWEPIKHMMNQDGPWITDVITRLDPSLPQGDALALVHAFNIKTREAKGTDFVFTAFVANSENAPGHIFHGADYTAYANLGGPFQITPYPAGSDPNGLGHWLVFSKIYQHETGHVFWTLDEYGSSPSTCGAQSGYLWYANMNKDSTPMGGPPACDPAGPFDCLMRYAARENTGRQWCKWSRGQMGVIDNNGNSVPDIYESKPKIVFQTPVKMTVEADEATIRLRGVSTAVPNKNQYQAPNIRKDYAPPLAGARYNVTGEWGRLTPLDGEWGGAAEDFTLTISGLPVDTFAVKFKVRNSVNFWSREYKVEIYYIGVRFTAVGLSLTEDRIRLFWDVDANDLNATYDVYRLDPGEQMPGQLIEAEVLPTDPDGFSFALDDGNIDPGTRYRYYVDCHYTINSNDYDIRSAVVEATAMFPITSGDILSYASPNPFAEQTQVSVTVPPSYDEVQIGGTGGGTYQQRVPSEFNAAVFDVAGRRVKTLINDRVWNDIVTVGWDGTNSKNVPVPSGVYFIRVIAGNATGVRKVLLIR